MSTCYWCNPTVVAALMLAVLAPGLMGRSCEVLAAEADALGPVPKQGVIVLRRGQVVEGKITRAGDHYHVVLPYGEIRLRAADVAMACRDLEEAYQRKRAAMTLGDVHCHIELANWCLHNDLVGHTAEELLDAMKADPRHPMIPVLQRRLEMKLEGPPEIDEPPKPTDHDAGPTREELDRLTRQLPGHAVERFTDTIQPLLLNHCLGSGCHGTDAAGDLRFSRL